MAKAKHPVQPVEYDDHGTIRFKKNALVEYLLDNGQIDLNQLAIKFNDPKFNDDRTQFAQLIGYSVSGWGGLSYVSDKIYVRAARKVDKLLKKHEK